MEAKGWLMLKVLINHYNPKAGDALLRFLPQSEALQIKNQKTRATDIMPILYQPRRMIEKMHYSWLQPLVDRFPEMLRPLVVASLTSEQIVGFQPKTAHSFSKLSLSQPVKLFILSRLYQSLDVKAHLPLEYLPETELTPLVHWSKKQLMNLIDFLGLHDLAAEVRRIVDRNQLKNLYDCLSPKQLYYLKICLHQKERLVPPKLGIDPKAQNCNKLKQILHRRGLIRLARAFAGQHEDLVWYVAHVLDKGRGKLLLDSHQSQTASEVTTVLKQQVVNLMNFLKKE